MASADAPTGARSLRRRRRRRVLRPRPRDRRRPAPADHVACWSSSGRPGAASRRWSAPASPPPCDATAAGSWSSLRRRPVGCSHGAAGPDGGAVLVVDQCEEAVSPLYRPGGAVTVPRRPRRAGRPGSARRRPACRPARGRLRRTRRSPGWSNAGCTFSGRWARTDLRAAIEGSARQAGLLLEPGLVDLLVREVEGEPGPSRCCPTRCARPGSDVRVARSRWRATGRRRHPGAVAQTAEEVYEGLHRNGGRCSATCSPPRHPQRRRGTVRIRVPRAAWRSTPTRAS